MRESPRRPFAQAADRLGRERPRVILLGPLALMAGAAWYLLRADEPSSAVIAGVAFACAALALTAALWPTPAMAPMPRAARGFVVLALALSSAFSFGALAGALKAANRPQTTLAAPVEAAALTGFILDRDRAGDRLRLLLQVTGFEGEATPRRVRISLPEGQAALLRPGRHVRCVADLSPPAPPLAPGTYDFQRRAFFDGLDGVGFARGRCRPAPAPTVSPWDRARLWLAAARSDLAAGILAAAPTQGGAIAAAMIVGDRSAMTEETVTALQDAGLAHIVSVSGLHMAVVGGFIFFLLKRGLALLPWLALRVPVSKIAAAAALAALALYLLISGGSVPAQRAAIMAAVAFGAILADRPPISMRGLGLAAMLIVLVEPEAVVEPGFQMSFAATMALVAAYEALAHPNGPRGSPGPLIGGLQAFGRGMTGAVATSAVAGAATELFAVQHFQRLTVYGLPVNLAAAPIIAFVVAPAAVAAAVLAPFGLAEAPLWVMATALDLILAFAEAFAARPEAVQPIPPLAPAAFGFLCAALIMLCLWRGPLRWTALPLALAGALAQGLAGPPVLVFDPSLAHVYARETDGNGVRLSEGRERSFERDRLLALLGATRTGSGYAALATGEASRRVPPTLRPLPCSEGQPCSATLPGGGEAVWAPPRAPTDPSASPSNTDDFTAAADRPSLRLTQAPVEPPLETASDRSGLVRSGLVGLTLRQGPAPDSDRPWRNSTPAP